MALVVLVVILAIPVVEIWAFIQAGEAIGAAPTIALTLLTAGVGVMLFRWQGTAIVGRLRSEMEDGRMPLLEIVDGFGLLIAGALLFLPGLVTDVIGFVLFIPPVRVVLIAAMVRSMMRRGHVHMSGGATMHRSPGGAGDRVVEAEFEEVRAEDDNASPANKDGPHRLEGPDSGSRQ